MVTRLLEVAPYAGAFVAVFVVILLAGVAIAKATLGPAAWSEDEPCPEWVLDKRDPEWPFAGPVWLSCPHRRPCPLHDARHRGGRHGRQS